MISIKPLASGSSGNCYYISDGKSSLLLDAGISIKDIRIGTGFKVSSLAGCLITHRHGDHSKAVSDLVKCGVDVYAPEDVFAALKLSSHRCKRLECGIVGGRAEKWTEIGSFRVLPFDVHHDVPNLGYYIHSKHTGENVLYFTDTYYLEYTFPGLHYVLAECNYDPDVVDENMTSGALPAGFKKRLVKSHMSIQTLIDTLKANDLSEIKQIHLLHLSDRNSRETEFRDRIRAEVGCEVYVC